MIVIVVAVQFLILCSVIAFKQYTIWTGETVLLKIQPVDPRDPFRGDYMVVSYEISRIDQERMPGYFGDNGYVELVEGDDGYWHAVALHDRRFHDFDDSVLIKAKSDYQRSSYPTLWVKYGIEQIFIPEGSGDQLPLGEPDHIISVKVKVDRFGNAVARGFYVDGEPFKLERR
jgi:uncharacterized membrane-anchored protein